MIFFNKESFISVARSSWTHDRHWKLQQSRGDNLSYKLMAITEHETKKWTNYSSFTSDNKLISPRSSKKDLHVSVL